MIVKIPINDYEECCNQIACLLCHLPNYRMKLLSIVLDNDHYVIETDGEISEKELNHYGKETARMEAVRISR